MTDFTQNFRQAYCSQQGIADFAEDCNVDHDRLKLVCEDERYFVLVNEAGFDGKYLLAETKQLWDGIRQMETIDLSSSRLYGTS